MHCLGFWIFRIKKRRKPLILLGFQRFLPSDIFDYFAFMSDLSKSLENRLGATPRGFESLCLRQTNKEHHLVLLVCFVQVVCYEKPCALARRGGFVLFLDYFLAKRLLNQSMILLKKEQIISISVLGLSLFSGVGLSGRSSVGSLSVGASSPSFSVGGIGSSG